MIDEAEQQKQNAQDAINAVTRTLNVMAFIIGRVSPLLGLTLSLISGAIKLDAAIDPDTAIKYLSKLIDIYNSATCETGDGWLVFTQDPNNPNDPNDLWITSGKWYWHDSNIREGQTWWLDLKPPNS